MRSNISFTWSLIVISIVGIAFSSIIILYGEISPVSSEMVFPLQTAPLLPMRLLIPKINVDASIESVGLAADGAMAVPAGPADAAWFDLGPRPGAIGSAVIAGHEGWKDNIPAVFDDLYKLKKGDKIYVEEKTGITIAFTVSSSATYDQNADPSEVFFSTDGKAHLNLITCEGVWNAAEQSYSDRLVVFADED